ncbi:hypothetical protein E3N88_15785 [Mikania micrantha]|uniref:Uncharacterized protein n=1 Tax=Mikania micrantha TaxID=192012 RepID=A0A5N6NZL6_9ASTR|nr:hypothetical protein E3N88_15785 [Mikania micrantha]
MELMNMVCKVVFKGIDSEGVSGTKRPGKELVIEDNALKQGGAGVSYAGGYAPDTPPSAQELKLSVIRLKYAQTIRPV